MMNFSHLVCRCVINRFAKSGSSKDIRMDTDNKEFRHQQKQSDTELDQDLPAKTYMLTTTTSILQDGT
jgi:hypothetical protein